MYFCKATLSDSDVSESTAVEHVASLITQVSHDFFSSQKHRSSPALGLPQVIFATKSIIHSFQAQRSTFIEQLLCVGIVLEILAAEMNKASCLP